MSDPTRDALKEALEGSPYAQPFTPDEIEDFWATHAMDNPSCETCRWLATITDLGFPGGHDAALSTTPAPDYDAMERAWLDATPPAGHPLIHGICQRLRSTP